MQTTHGEKKGQTDDIISIHFKDELEDFDFRPITKGLGIQKPAVKSDATQHRKKRTNVPSSQEPNSIRQLPLKAMPTTSMVNRNVTTAPVDTQMASFYSSLQTAGNTSAIPSVKTSNKPITEKFDSSSARDVQATSIERISAWLVDIAVVAIFMIIVVFCFSLFSGIELAEILSSVGMVNAGLFFFSIFSIFYIFYFTVLDSTETIGKNLFKLKIVTDGKPISMTTSFVRSFVSLLFIITLGFPFILDLHSKMTNTSVVKNV